MDPSSDLAAEVKKTSPPSGPSDPTPAERPRRLFPAANSLATAMALSASAGYLDAFTYIGHGQVFASAMTGNMVLLGINLAALNRDTMGYVYPVLAYVVGVFVAHVMMRERVRRHLFGRPHVVTLLLEIAVLLGVAFWPFQLADKALVSIITVSTSMQNTSFRNIGTRTYNSVIMTGNLQNFSNALAAGVWPFTPARLAEARDLGGVVGSFIGGAVLGALLTPRVGLHAIVPPAGLLAIGAVLLLLSHDGSR